MSEDLVNLAQRWPERAATHYDGCEANHVGCLVKKLAREVERLTRERDEARAELLAHCASVADEVEATADTWGGKDAAAEIGRRIRALKEEHNGQPLY